MRGALKAAAVRRAGAGDDRGARDADQAGREWVRLEATLCPSREARGACCSRLCPSSARIYCSVVTNRCRAE
jgi:hypothetical protein